MTGPRVKTVCIIGTGLIGGSLALALRESGFCESITGAGRTESTLQRAVELGVIDSYSTSIAEAASTADPTPVAPPPIIIKSQVSF